MVQLLTKYYLDTGQTLFTFVMQIVGSSVGYLAAIVLLEVSGPLSLKIRFLIVNLYYRPSRMLEDTDSIPMASCASPGCMPFLFNT